MLKKENKPSTWTSFPTFEYSPGDTVRISLDSGSASRGREVIVKKITKVYTTFTNNHKCKHEHVLPRLRTPRNSTSARIEVLQANFKTMQVEMNEIVFLMDKLQTRMKTTAELIEDVKREE